MINEFEAYNSFPLSFVTFRNIVIITYSFLTKCLCNVLSMPICNISSLSWNLSLGSLCSTYSLVHPSLLSWLIYWHLGKPGIVEPGNLDMTLPLCLCIAGTGMTVKTTCSIVYVLSFPFTFYWLLSTIKVNLWDNDKLYVAWVLISIALTLECLKSKNPLPPTPGQRFSLTFKLLQFTIPRFQQEPIY